MVSENKIDMKTSNPSFTPPQPLRPLLPSLARSQGPGTIMSIPICAAAGSTRLVFIVPMAVCCLIRGGRTSGLGGGGLGEGRRGAGQEGQKFGFRNVWHVKEEEICVEVPHTLLCAFA